MTGPGEGLVGLVGVEWSHVQPHHESWLFRNRQVDPCARRTLGGAYQPVEGGSWTAWVNTPEGRHLIGDYRLLKQARVSVEGWWQNRRCDSPGGCVNEKHNRLKEGT